eukprot:s1577_g3.t1
MAGVPIIAKYSNSLSAPKANLTRCIHDMKKRDADPKPGTVAVPGLKFFAAGEEQVITNLFLLVSKHPGAQDALGHSLTKAQWQSQKVEGLRDPSADDLLAEDDEEDKDLQDAECLKMRIRNREDAERLMGLERKMAEQDTDLARLTRAVRELRSLTQQGTAP